MNEEEYFENLHKEELETDQLVIPRTPKGDTKLPWEKFYMSIAYLARQRSEDPNTRVGACIVNQQRKIAGIGYNMKPAMISSEKFSPYWKKREIGECSYEKTKYPYVCHAAINAILNKNAESLEGCTLYTTLFPSHEDAKMIIQAGIKEVVYYEDKYHDKKFTEAARLLFTKAKVWYTAYKSLPVAINYPEKSLMLFPINDEKCPQAESRDSATKTKQSTVPHPTQEDSIPPKQVLCDNDYFMAVACLASQRSKDPTRKVGACIVNKDEKIVGIGYNGFPRQISDDDPDISWGKEGCDPLKVKYPFVVHAEVNAILHKTCIDLKGCKIYTTLFPCNECVKVILQSGIEEIYYLMDSQGVDPVKGNKGLVEWDHPEREGRTTKKKISEIASQHLLRMANFSSSGISPSDGAKSPPKKRPRTDGSSSNAYGDIEAPSPSVSTPRMLCQRYIPSCEMKVEFPADAESSKTQKPKAKEDIKSKLRKAK